MKFKLNKKYIYIIKYNYKINYINNKKLMKN